MIGAIKRRWKSKKAKVLHKGGELSTSTDSCPASRGFVDGPDDFDKMIKPPSPRQVHPVLEKGDMKYGAHQYLQHQQQRKKSLTLPSSEEGCPFIRVNSGRIELVSKESWKGNSPNDVADKIILADSRIGGRLRNDTRHSWCGSAFRQQNEVAHQKKSLLLEDQVARCGSRSQKQSQSQGTSGDEQTPQQPLSRQMQLQMPILENGHSQCNGNTVNGSLDFQEEMQVSLSPLRERLAAIEGITANLQNWQSKEKTEYEQCVSDLATQVSRAVALQQLMKSEVEKLQQRVVHLENHNKAMATMIIPTLMKLHDTVGKESGNKSEKADVCVDVSGKSSPTSEKENKSSQPQSASVKSPKHRKIDCRIPRINCRSNRNNSSMTSSAPNPCLSVNNNESGNEGLPQSGKVSSNICSSKNSRTACVESSPSLSLSLSPSHTKRSDHSTNSSSAQSNQNGGRVSCQRSSTYSGIPRMSSPRPANRTAPNFSKQSAGSVNTSCSGKENKTRKSCSAGHREQVHPVTSTPISKLPIRKNLSNSSTSSSSSSSSAKPKAQRGSSGNKSNTHPKTTSPSPLSSTTMNGKGSLGSKINTNTYVKSKPTSSTLLKAMAMTISGTTAMTMTTTSASPSVSGKPKAGKDEGYSTMSSEALAEQEKTEESQALGKSSGSSIIKSNTFNTLREMKLMSSDNTNSYSNYNNFNNNKNKSSARSGDQALLPNLPREKFQMMCNGSVRIYRGTPYEVEIGVEGEADSEEQSTSTILWEDSDDSDILFLPLEMSSELESTIGSSSRSTLVPSASSISYRDREKLTGTPSSRSSASRMSNGKMATTQILLTSDKDKEPTVPSSPLRKGITTNGKGELVILNGGAGGGNSDEIEERALIEKWMRLEDVRNEVQWDDEWAWDWDGVERTHKSLQTHATNTQLSIIPLRHNVPDIDDVDADVDFWFSSPSTAENSPEKVFAVGLGQQQSKEPQETKCGSAASQIDSSTWTKSRNRRLKCKLSKENEVENESLELKCNSPEIQKKQETFSSRRENEKEIRGVINGDCADGAGELEEEVEVARRENVDMSSQFRSPSPSPTTASNNIEDSAAPVIEFTPEFYHLVNYGSNLSFSDNDSSSQSHHISHSNSNTNQRTKKTGEKGVKSSPRKCKLSSATSPNSRMDDKISQTDFSSSHENLSVSSELFTECRNCLEIIKKLVGSTAISLENCGSSDATLDRNQKHERAEMKTDLGCPTTWLSVPKGLPTTEVDRILEILSSSESEDVLSPSK